MQESQAITRKSASNLALAFILLPKEKRDGMSALYAFCREVDDVADDESVAVEKRREQLAAWRVDIRRACEKRDPEFVVNRELQAIIEKYKLPFAYFDDLIRGVEMDLDIKRYETYEDLEKYCYRVASVVGLLSIEIFGYKNPACRDYAIHLGKALQLTNILRDVRTDGERGRIYLPLCELKKSGVTENEILRFEYTDRFHKVAANVAERAKTEDRRSMIAAELMGSVYWRLLGKLERKNFDVFGPTTTRLNKLQKMLLIFRTWHRVSSGAMSPNYGV
jgi:phytoene synthase